MKAMKQILEIILFIGLFGLLLIPFLYSSELYFPFITTKAFLFRAIVEVLFGAWVGLAIIEPRYRPKKSWILWSFSGLLLIMLIANLLGVDVEKSMWSNYERMDGYVTLVHVFALFLVAGSFFTTVRRWWVFWHASILLSLGHFIIALKGISDGDRADAFFGNPIYLAVFMLFHVFITLYYLLGSKSKNIWFTYGYIVAALIQVITIMLTATRGTTIGLVGGLILTFLIIGLFTKGNALLRNISLGVVVLIIVSVGGLFLAKDTSFVQETSVFKRITAISLEDNTTFSRLLNWQMAWEASMERPLLGYGQGNYGPIYDEKYDPRLWNQEQWFDRSHNVLLDWLVAGGWLALVAYLAIFVTTCWLIVNKKSTFNLGEKAVLIGLLAGYFVHNIFVFDNLTSYMMFAFLLAMIHMRNGNTWLNAGTYNRTAEVGVTYATIALVIGIILVPTVNAASLKQNYILIDNMRVQADNPEALLEQFKAGAALDTYGQSEYRQQLLIFTSSRVLGSEGISEETKLAFAQFAAEEALKEIEENPNEARPHFIVGQYFAQIGEFQIARQLLERAIELSPQKQMLRQPYIEVLFKMEEADEALRVAKDTYELNTENRTAWAQYVRMLTRLDMNEEADKLIEASYEENNGGHVIHLLETELRVAPNNAQTYASLAAAYIRIGDTEKAIEIFTQLGDAIPEAKPQADEVIAKLLAGEEI